MTATVAGLDSLPIDVADAMCAQADAWWAEQHPGIPTHPALRLQAWLRDQIRAAELEDDVVLIPNAAVCGRCRGYGRVAAPGTENLHGNDPGQDDITCPVCREG